MSTFQPETTAMIEDDVVPASRRGMGGPTGLPFDTVALVLQGGGALGSYQAGAAVRRWPNLRASVAVFKFERV